MIAYLFLLGLTGSLAFGADAALKKALTFHASFDKTTDADFALGDRRIHTATSYRERGDAKPGLGSPDVAIAAGRGRFGDALHFKKKNVRAIYYPAEKNIAYDPSNWSGTVSFWLSLDPDKELEPGFCDPIQITDEAFNDAAIWVDFTKDERPRHFRLGVFGDLKAWNPKDIPADKNPDFTRRLIVNQKPPFAAGKWTNVVITWSGLGSPQGKATLYLDAAPQGTTQTIREPFGWDLSRAAIRVGVNYVGLFDELALFNRALTANEVRELHRLRKGISELR